MKDISAERILLGTLIHHGKDAISEVADLLCPSDFAVPLNRAVYAAIKDLYENDNIETIDVETIKLKINALGMKDFIATPKDIEYLELLESGAVSKDNVAMFAYTVKKYAIVRDLHLKHSDAIKFLENIDSKETVSNILKKSEGIITDYLVGINENNKIELLTQDLDEYIKQQIEKPIVKQIGVPTGFPIYDDAIGGGLRGGTVMIIGARPKVAKSFTTMNMSLNIAKTQKIPVLYLDSELTREYQLSRLICIESACPIQKFETRQFKNDKNMVQAVIESAKLINNIPLYYESIAGLDCSQVLSVIKRWLIKIVGFDETGKAKPCAIFYDYLKLTSGEGLSSYSPEWLLIGLMLTQMHNFCVTYNVPIVALTQLNRDGIDNQDTGVIAQSDRIAWLASSISIIKNKDETDLELGCGWEYGNKKIIVLETRQGSGLEIMGDYINLRASLRPGVSKEVACGSIVEGFKFSDISGRRKENKPSDNRQDKPTVGGKS